MLEPLHHRLAAHVMSAERLHGDDTTVPVLARSLPSGPDPRGKTATGRIWTYVRDDFFVLADLEAGARYKADGKKPVPISPLALEIVQRMDRLFEVERAINGQSSPDRLMARQQRSAPMVDELEALLLKSRPGLSRHDDLAKAMEYMLKRWPVFTRFLDDGRVCLTNNAAERALRGIALGRKAWLADVLARIADHPSHQLDDLLPWNWAAQHQIRTAS